MLARQSAVLLLMLCVACLSSTICSARRQEELGQNEAEQLQQAVQKPAAATTADPNHHHANCSAVAIESCSDQRHCVPCINSRTRENVCLDEKEAAKYKQGGLFWCGALPPQPPGSCAGQMRAYCKPPECVWCKAEYIGEAGCYSKYQTKFLPKMVYKCSSHDEDQLTEQA